MSASEVLARYELLSSLTAQMREAAQSGAWEQVSRTEQECIALISALKLLDAETQLDEAEQARKRQLIEKTLADDVTIRALAQARLDDLRSTMQSGRQEQRLLKTYKS